MSKSPHIHFRVIGCLVAILLLAGAPAMAKDPDPRAIYPAERAAAQLALDYLAEGAEAWWEKLAEDSQLKQLGREDALKEIEVRAGPPEGAIWQLQTPAPRYSFETAIFALEFPSGIEETLLLEMVDESGWKIARISSLVDPVKVNRDLRLGITPNKDRKNERGKRRSIAWPAGGSSQGPPPAALPAFLAAVLGLLAWIAWSAPPRGRLRAPAGALLAALLVVTVFACGKDDGPAVVEAPENGQDDQNAKHLVRLGGLLPLRQMYAAAEPVDPATLAGAVPGEPAIVAEVARLWEAQYHLNNFDLEAAAETLEKSVSETLPLANLLRARLAYFEGEDDKADGYYSDAAVQGPNHDGLGLEEARVLGLLGMPTESEVAFRLLNDMGSRLADVYYAMATFEMMNESIETGEKALRVAWYLRPAERQRLFNNPLLANLMTRPKLLDSFSVSSSQEPFIAGTAKKVTPLVLPDGAHATTLGNHLDIRLAKGHLAIPGGAGMAPLMTRLVDAAWERERKEKEVLDRLEELVAQTREHGSLALMRSDAIVAVSALAREERWEDLVRMTEGVTRAVDRVPPDLVKLRAVALEKTGWENEARDLLIKLAKSERANKRRDPGTFFQLAEIFAAKGEYDLAIRLIKKGNSLSPWLANRSRIRQIEMEQKLAEAANVYLTKNFDIRYPRITGEEYASDLGQVLEAERQRIARWVPVPPDTKVDVDLYPVREFMEAYSSQILVVGLFDGRVRVPFADLYSLHPELVSILSHELGHAMIAAATNDLAPRWFHEGLAQHVEMVQDVINPVPDLFAKGRVLSLPVVESILAGFSEPQFVDLAYGEAVWAVHSIEARFGVSGIHKMLDAYSRGLDTEEVIQEVFGMSLNEFDRQTWRWCLNDAPLSWPTKLRRYDAALGTMIKTRSAATRPPEKLAVADRRPSKSTMRMWHKNYSDQTKAVKQALIPVVKMSRDELPWDNGSSCQALAQQLELVKPRIFSSPDPDATIALRGAYANLAKMAEICQTAKSVDDLRPQVDFALSSLGKAKEALAQYGLNP